MAKTFANLLEIYYLGDMFKKIADRLFSKKTGVKVNVDLADIARDKDGQPLKDDTILAVAALLIYLASSDDQVAKEEAEAICVLLAFNLNLAAGDIPQIIEKALVRRREMGKLEEFVALINNSYTIEQRVRVLAMCWKLIMSDNKVERPEERMLVRISNAMYLRIEQQEKARRFAEDGLV